MKRLVVFMIVCGIVSYATAVPITGLQLHLDASDLGLSDGATVSSWADSSGLGNNATSPGTATYIDNALNGQAVVSITGSLTADGQNWTGQNDDFFALTNAIHNVKTVAMVFKKTSNDYYSWAPILGSVSGTSDFHADQNWGTTYFSKDYAENSVKYSDIWINGTSIGAGNGGYTNVPTEYHVMTLTVQDGWGSDVTIDQIASSVDVGYVSGIDLAEILVYDQFLTTPQLEQLTWELGNEYDIPVSVVPEPASMVLLGLGACLLRRKR